MEVETIREGIPSEKSSFRKNSTKCIAKVNGRVRLLKFDGTLATFKEKKVCTVRNGFISFLEAFDALSFKYLSVSIIWWPFAARFVLF